MRNLGSIFGLIEDSPDVRDKPFYLSTVVNEVKGEVDVSDTIPTAVHQGILGTCTCQATAAMMEHLYPGTRISVLQLYWDARVEGGYNPRFDSGSQIRDAMKVLQKKGAIPEDAWPYITENFDDPPPEYTGDRMSIGNYARINSLDDALKCLTLSHPFVLSIDLPEYFDHTAGVAGVLPKPLAKVEHVGLHAMLAVGYDTNFRASAIYAKAIEDGMEPEFFDDVAFLVRNSWGHWWGLQDAPEHRGHFWLPSTWITNRSLVGDCWTGFKNFTTTDAPEGPTVAGVPVRGQFRT